jgi:hypothetical protein
MTVFALSGWGVSSLRTVHFAPVPANGWRLFVRDTGPEISQRKLPWQSFPRLHVRASASH